jgi:hypothetical protein
MKLAVATLLAACACSVYGGPPTKTSMYGIELGSTLRQVFNVLVARYPDCEAEIIDFPDEVRTEGVERVYVKIEPGADYRNCSKTQPSTARTASLAVFFVSKEVDSVGGAYEVRFQQHFHPRQSPTPTIGELLARLSTEYGEPTEVRNERMQAVGPTDMPIKNLLYYQVYAIWFDKASLKGGTCKAATCSGYELYASFSAHAPPGKKSADLPAGTMSILLRDVRLDEGQKDWYGKKVGAKK